MKLRMCEVINKIIEGVNELEDLMCEYSELNSFLFAHNKIFMIASNFLYNTPEYNHQPYTFKYGEYSSKDYITKYI